MAEIESKLKITASAAGMAKITRDADKMAEAFKRVGDAGEAMGKKTAAGINAQEKAITAIYNRNRGILGRGADLFTGRKGLGGSGGSAGFGFGGGGGTTRSGGRRRGGGGGSVVNTPALPSELPGGAPGAPPPPPGGGGDGGGGSRSGGGNSPQRSRSFGRGFLMGGLGIDYLDYANSPADARRQAAGIMAGRLARRTGQSALDIFQASTQGSGAAAGAVSGIPLIGGLLGATVLHNTQAAQQEIQTQAAMSPLMPMIDGSSGNFTQRMDAQRQRLGPMGRRFAGLNSNATLGLFASAAAQSGGTVAGFGTDRLGYSLLAQQARGVDLGTSMRILRGEDLGQTAGPSAKGTLRQALGNADALGLQGTEVSNYLRQIAEAVTNVNMTGIKFSSAGQGDLERALQATMGGGVAGTRIQTLGQGVEAGFNSLAERGPQNANQAFMLEAAGFDPERPQTYARALRSLEDPSKRAGIFRRAQRLVLRSGRGFDKDTQAEMVRSFLQDNNAQVSHTEARNIIDAGGIGAQQARMDQNLGSSSGVSDQDLARQAASNTPLSAQQTAYNQNLDTQMGLKSIDSVAQLDSTAKQLQSQIQGLGQSTLRMVQGLSEIAKSMSSFVFGPSGPPAGGQVMR